jgi:hypothetical protein
MQTVIATIEPPRKSVTGHKSKVAHDVPGIAQIIKEHWGKSVEGILRVAQECAKAKATLNEDQMKALYALLSFKAPMFSKLASIGEKPQLVGHKHLLPVSISTIYEAGKLPADRFEKAVNDGILTPNVRREDIRDWQNGKKSSRSKTPMTLPWGLYCMYSDSPLPAETDAVVRKDMLKLAEQQGLKVANFSGESLLADFKSHWTKKPQTARTTSVHRNKHD